MKKYITKIKLHNYKRFEDFAIDFDENINVIIGDNDAGKSSILEAVDLVLNPSNSRLTTIGYESLMNISTVENFLNGDRTVDKLPELYIELYLSDQNRHDLNGRNNSESRDNDGLALIIKPDKNLAKEITDFLKESNDTFPFDYYSSSYIKFSGEPYYSARKIISSTLIDNTRGNNEYVINEFIKNAYSLNLKDDQERAQHRSKYRVMKKDFSNEHLKELNERIEGGEYSFHLKTTSKANLETDLILMEEGVSLENRGKGRQVIIKAKMTLEKAKSKPDVVLIEEPENHLSHANMNKLIETIKTNQGQLLVSTHSNLISSRLDLQHCILINSSSKEPLRLNDLTDETANYFMKSPPHDVLDFVLSKKSMLVEGAAEYILIEELYKNVRKKSPAEEDVHVISVGGTAFRRYLEIAKVLGIKVAVLRDNDSDPNNAESMYNDYMGDNQKVFTDSDSNNSTFEKSFYSSNAQFCDSLFLNDRKTLSVEDYMLKNKTEAAFSILNNLTANIVVPEYILKAIKWISE